MTVTSAEQGSKSAFLDTNSLVPLFVYWQICKDHGIALDSVSDLQSLKSKLGRKVRLIREIPSDDYEPIRVGMKCYHNLRNAYERYLFYTSALCETELHHTLLTSIANERLVRRRVPHSLRIKRPQVIYRRALETSDYSSLAVALNEFFDSLRYDYSISIKKVEDPAEGPIVSFDTILDAAKQIWSRVLIEVMDAYVYASAVMIDADIFITSDEPLKDALNRLNQPSSVWQSAARSLKIALGKNPADPLPCIMRPTGELP